MRAYSRMSPQVRMYICVCVIVCARDTMLCYNTMRCVNTVRCGAVLCNLGNVDMRVMYVRVG